MNASSQYIFLPKISLSPDRIVMYNEVVNVSKCGHTYDEAIRKNQTSIRRNVSNGHKKMLVKQFHNFEISDNAYRNLKQKINWLYYLSKARYIKTYSHKKIFNFKIGFITFTLPSKQQHPTTVITSECFNQCLTELRQRTGMENYVWRLEFQKNGNVHYHLVTDTYLDYFFVQKIWNRCLEKLGYVSTYSDKMSKLTLMQYVNLRNKKSEVSFNDCAKAYARGKIEKWRNPNSVDVKSCTSGKAIANYISKYFAKTDKTGVKCNALDTAENSSALRLWFCSRSLSKLKTFNEYHEATEYDLFSVVSTCKKVRLYVGRYCRILYYQMNAFTHDARRIIETLLRNYAYGLAYRPAT